VRGFGSSAAHGFEADATAVNIGNRGRHRCGPYRNLPATNGHPKQTHHLSFLLAEVAMSAASEYSFGEPATGSQPAFSSLGEGWFSLSNG